MITGGELRERRKQAGLTQDALGALLGIKASAVSQWEAGTTVPSWQNQQKLDEIFNGVKPDDRDVVKRLEAELVAQRAELAELAAIVKQLQAERRRPR